MATCALRACATNLLGEPTLASQWAALRCAQWLLFTQCARSRLSASSAHESAIAAVFMRGGY